MKANPVVMRSSLYSSTSWQRRQGSSSSFLCIFKLLIGILKEVRNLRTVQDAATLPSTKTESFILGQDCKFPSSRLGRLQVKLAKKLPEGHFVVAGYAP